MYGRLANASASKDKWGDWRAHVDWGFSQREISGTVVVCGYAPQPLMMYTSYMLKNHSAAKNVSFVYKPPTGSPNPPQTLDISSRDHEKASRLGTILQPRYLQSPPDPTSTTLGVLTNAATNKITPDSGEGSQTRARVVLAPADKDAQVVTITRDSFPKIRSEVEAALENLGYQGPLRLTTDSFLPLALFRGFSLKKNKLKGRTVLLEYVAGKDYAEAIVLDK